MFENSISSAMMEKSLSALWQRQQLIMHNIANEDTPGYKAKRLSFEDALQKEMTNRTRVTAGTKRQMLDRVEQVRPVVYDDDATAVRADGNNVNLLNEQIEMARTQIHFNALQQKISGHYTTLKYAISGGR